MPSNKQESRSTIIALAGRRTDASDTNTVRFPLSNVESVGNELRDLFLRRGASKLVCSAACGADLIALDVASNLGIESHVIIPFSISEFKRVSVTDLPGDWGVVYDRIISRISKQGLLKILGCESDDDSAFSKANKSIIEEARSLSSKNIVPLAVVVWEGASSSKVDATREFLDLAQKANFDTATILSN